MNIEHENIQNSNTPLDDFKKLKPSSKGVIVAVTILASLATLGLGSTRAFRSLVKKYTVIQADGIAQEPVANRINAVSAIIGGGTRSHASDASTFPPLQDLKSQQAALSLFALYNADFTSYDFGQEITLIPELTLSFLITELEKLKDHPRLSQENKEVEALIQSYRSAYIWTVRQKQLGDCCHDPKALLAEKLRIKDEMLSSLKAGKPLSFASGYSAIPAGHVIAMYLKPIEKDGKMYVKAEIANRGEGIHYHVDSFIHAGKRYIDPWLALNEVPIEDLENSPFLIYLQELSLSMVPEIPKELSAIKLEKTTAYSIKEFYEVLLPTWPGTISAREKKVMASEQHAGTCSLKPYTTEMKDVLSDPSALFIKVHLAKATLENLLTHHDSIDTALFSMIDQAADKLMRRVVKLQKIGGLSEEEVRDLNKFNESVRAIIQPKLELNRKEIEKHESDLLVGLTSSEVYSLDLSNGTPLAAGIVNREVNVPLNTSKEISQLLKNGLKQAKSLKKSDKVQDMNCLIVQIMEKIPVSTDPYWATKADENAIKSLCQLNHLMIASLTGRPGIYSIPSLFAIISLKTFAIVSAAAHRLQLPESLVRFFVASALPLIQVNENNFCLTTPWEVEEFREATKLLKGYGDSNQKMEIGLEKAGSGVYTFHRKNFTNIRGANEDLLQSYLLTQKNISQVVRLEEARFNQDPNSLASSKDFYTSPMRASILVNDAEYFEHARYLMEYKRESLQDRRAPVFLGLQQCFMDCLFAFYLSSGRVTASTTDVNQALGFTKEEDLNNLNITRLLTKKFWEPLDGSYEKGRAVAPFLTAHHLQANVKDIGAVLQPEVLASAPLEAGQNDILRARDSLKLSSGAEIPATQQHLFAGRRLYSVLSIPLWIQYLTAHTGDVSDPALDVFLTAGLFNKMPGSDLFQLERVMQENTQVKFVLFDFLKKRILSTTSPVWLDMHLKLVRVYTQALSFAKTTGVNIEAEFLDKQLTELCQFSSRTLTDGQKGKILTQIIALTPHCRWSLELGNHCISALRQHNELGLTFDFSYSKEIELDYFRGVRELSELHPDVGESKFPSWILDNIDFPYRSPTSFRCLSEGYYSFINSYGHLTYLTIDGNKLHLYRKFQDPDGKEELYEYKRSYVKVQQFHRGKVFSTMITDTSPYGDTFPTNHPCELGNGVFNSRVTYWYRVNGSAEALCINKNESAVLCYADTSGVHFPDRKEQLTLIANSALLGPAIQSILRLYGGHHTCIWKNSANEVIKVTIPELKLTFDRQTLKEGNEVWMSSHPPGYYLDSQDKVADFEPFSHYVKLRNATGSKIVMTLNHTIPHFQPKFPAELSTPQPEKNPKILLYAVDQSHNITLPDSLYSTLYLGYLALKKQDYPLLDKLVKHLKKESFEWDSESVTFLKCFEWDPTYGSSWLTLPKMDFHPAASALRIQLKLLQSTSLNSESLTPKQDRVLLRDYSNYLDKWNNAMEYRLSQDEELECLKVYKSCKFSIDESEKLRFNTRLEFLNGDQLQTVTTYRKPRDYWIWYGSEYRDKPFFIINEPKIFALMKKHENQPLPIVLNIRPGAAFIANFLYYLKIAKRQDMSDPEFIQLKEILRCSRFGVDNRVNALADVLHGVLSSNKQCDQFICKNISWSDVCNICRKLEEIRFSISEPKEWSFQNKFVLSATTPMPVPRSTLTLPMLEPSLPIPVHEAEGHGKGMVLHNLGTQLISLGYLSRLPSDVHVKKLEDDRTVLRELGEIYQTPVTAKEDPCVTRVQNRIDDGIKETEAQLPLEPPIRVDGSKLSDLKGWLARAIVKNGDKTDKLATQILDLMVIRDPYFLAEQKGAMRKELNLNEVMLAVANEAYDVIREANPSMTPEELGTLKAIITQYLLLKTEQQLYIRAIKKIEEIEQLRNQGLNDQSSEVILNLDKLAQTLSTNRAYSDGSDLHLILFECFTDIRLKKEQYDAYVKLANPNSLENLEFEAPTGFGKSSVLIALWLLKMSRSRPLSMMTLPPALMDSARTLLREKLGIHFDKSFLILNFNRKRGGSVEYLKRIVAALEDAKKQKKIILISIDTLHRLCNLQLKESLNAKSQDQVTNELITLRKIIMKDLSNFVDESRECFDIRRRYDYAIGAPKFVTQASIIETRQLYETHLLSPEVTGKFNFEFLPQLHSAAKITITQDNYDNLLLPLLAKSAAGQFPAVIQLITEKDFQKIRLTAGENELLQQELGANLKLQRTYNHLKVQLIKHLKNTLSRNCDEHYGIDPNKTSGLAEPMLHGVLKPKSEFATIEELKNFSLQANLKTPLMESTIQSFIIGLSTEILKDVEHVASSSKFKFYQAIAKALKLPDLPENLDEDGIKKIVNYLNHPNYLRVKVKFISIAVLPKITYFSQKVTSSPFQLIRAHHHVQAASGTVEPDTLPAKMKTEEKKSTPIGNLAALWKSSRDRVHTIAGTDAAALLTNTLIQDDQACVIIDTGGLFRGLSQMHIAETILQKTAARNQPIEGVLFFDDSGKRFVLHRNQIKPIPASESALDPKELFIYIRQSKAVGSDEIMPLTARALTTISHLTPHDLLLQGIGRMRQLQEGQSTGIVCPQDQAKIMLERLGDTEKKTTVILGLEHVLKHTTLVQGEIKGKDNFFALNLCLEDLFEQELWKHIDLNASQPAAPLYQIFADLERVLVATTEAEDGQLASDENNAVPIEDAVKTLKGRYVRIADLMKKEHPSLEIDVDGLLATFDQYVDYAKLPKTINMNSTNELNCEVDIDVDAELLTEVVQEVASQQETDNTAENITELQQEQHGMIPQIDYEPAHLTVWNGNYVEKMKEKPVAIQLGVDIIESPNINYVSNDTAVNEMVRKPADHYLICFDRTTKQYRYAPLDLYDANIVMIQMEKHGGNTNRHSDANTDYFLCSGDHILAFDGQNKDFERSNSQIKAIRLLNKIHRGISSLSDQEKINLKTALAGPNQQQFREYIESYAIAWPELKKLSDLSGKHSEGDDVNLPTSTEC
ncbi:MAG: DUF3638 domain-containing protein [Parachlamydiaceae bacterium]